MLSFTKYVRITPYDDYSSLITVHCVLGKISLSTTCKISLSTTRNRQYYVTNFCITPQHLLNLVPLVH